MNMTPHTAPAANEAWLARLDDVLVLGDITRPRGLTTRDQLSGQLVMDMRSPVITIPERKLSYQFMAAEAYWMLTGDNTVEGIAPWNKNIANFSDDGKVFFGAYGPRIAGQLDYVVNKLVEDPGSRQAGLTIWRENPTPTKDYPCTVSMFFRVNARRMLDATVFMRSNDVWLGTPYDIFNFSMAAHLVCCRLFKAGLGIEPGALRLTAASSHLYEKDWVSAGQMVRTPAAQKARRVPLEYATNEQHLLDALKALRDTKPGDSLRWWEQPRAA